VRRSRRLVSLLTLLTAFTFVAAACGDDSGSSSATTGGGTATTAAGGAATTASGGAATTGASGEALPACGGTKDVKGSADNTLETRTLTQASGVNNKIGMMYDITGRGDQSFNDSAGAGLDKAKADFGIQATESTPTGDADRADRLNLLASSGNGLIIGVGFLWGDAITAGAKANTGIDFGIIDSVVDAPNVVAMTFAEEQGSFLVGAAAAMKSKTGHIGFIGGVENDLIKKFEAGYTAGAKQVNPDIKVDVKYISQPPDFSGFNDPAKGKEIAAAMYEGGADIVYAAAGGSGLGMFQAAKEYSDANNTHVCGIGVDSDQILTVGADLEPYVMTSMLKRVDVAVYNTIGDYLEGKAKVGTDSVFDLKVNGVAYSTTGGNLEDIKSKLDDLKQQIIDGKITVPTAPAG
jgi:basic membrane protein A and related proteins